MQISPLMKILMWNKLINWLTSALVSAVIDQINTLRPHAQTRVLLIKFVTVAVTQKKTSRISYSASEEGSHGTEPPPGPPTDPTRKPAPTPRQPATRPICRNGMRSTGHPPPPAHITPPISIAQPTRATITANHPSPISSLFCHNQRRQLPPETEADTPANGAQPHNDDNSVISPTTVPL